MSRKHKDKRGHNESENGYSNAEPPPGGSSSEVLTQMSIEDTNKMRAELGLAPLVVDTVDHSAEEEARARREQQETDDLRQELARRRKARMANEAEGESLGDQLTSSSGGSAADWLQRSRVLHEEKEKQEKLQKQKEKEEKKKKKKVKKEDEPGYTPEDLAGFKVRHNFDEFEEGKQTILTLKDKYIVKHIDGQERLDDDEDELENVNMLEDQKRKRNEDRKKKKTGYDVHDEKGATVLLAQYEEEKDYVGEMRLGTAAQHLAEIRAKLRADLLEKEPDDGKVPVDGKQKYSLDFEVSFKSDYMRPDEIPTFKKKKKTGKKKERKIRKAKLVLEEPTTFEEHKKDHGSRSVSAALMREAEEDAQRRALADKSYLVALNKAEKESVRLVQVTEEDEDQDAELATSLERARRLASQQKGARSLKEEDEEDERKNQASDRHAKTLANLIRVAQDEEKKKKQRVKDEEQKEGDSIKIKTEPKDDDVLMEDTALPTTTPTIKSDIVFTTTTEFCRGLQNEEDETLEQKAAQDKLREQIKQEIEQTNPKAMEFEEEEKKKTR